MLRNLCLVIIGFLMFTGFSHAELSKCGENLLTSDVIAVDFDKNGKEIEYHRTPQDIERVLVVLNQKISNDPSITQSPYWHKKMLTPDYWAQERCGGTKNCSQKECSGGKSCVYRNMGMAGCRCE